MESSMRVHIRHPALASAGVGTLEVQKENSLLVAHSLLVVRVAVYLEVFCGTLLLVMTAVQAVGMDVALLFHSQL